MGTAVETRDVLSKVPGVIRVHPNGVTGKTLVYVKDKNAVTEKLLTEAMEKTEKLRLRKMSKADAEVQPKSNQDESPNKANG